MGQVTLKIRNEKTGWVVERESDFDVAVSVMDDEIREAVHSDLAPCSEQAFMDEYCKCHEAKYNELFAVP